MTWILAIALGAATFADGPAPASQLPEPGSAGRAEPAEPPGLGPRAGAAPVQEAPRLTVTFDDTPIQDVLFTFADFANRSIVAGPSVTGTVTAEIRDQPWDVALQAILQAQGFRADEDEFGIIRVDDVQALSQRESVEPLVTRTYRINFATAAELDTAIATILTPGRGSVSPAQGANALIVTDLERVHGEVQQLIQQLDIRTPQVMIEGKILLVNRTDLDEFGIVYDLKDSQGNQLNVVTPGAVDLDGDGTIELPEEEVETGTNVISLGGNSIAALGNATNRVAGPALTLLTSLLVGRHTLINFIEALESVNLSDIQAVPTVQVVDNVQARIQVGEITPLRVIDAGAAAVGGALPVANVTTQNTGIILTATPHVTANEMILLDLHAERSAPQLAESDVGFIFTTQNAQTRVLVRDGQTVVIGGLTVTELTEVRSGIPLLMDLPLLGRLFRVTRESRIQRDLIIMVTPHIVRDGAP